MSSCLSLTLRSRNKLLDSVLQYSIHSEIIQGNNEPAFDLNGMVPGGYWEGFPWVFLVYIYTMIDL